MGAPGPPPTPAEVARLQRSLVEGLRARGLIRSPEVEAAFLAVPRHAFVPNQPLERVYADEVIPTKVVGGVAISSSSQPAIMAIMLEQLGLRRGQRVLEIGAGTGYNAALMAHIVGESGRVVAVDIDEDIVAGAREHLAAAGLGRVEVVLGDGARGHAEGAPYDRVILTVAASDISWHWVEQLAPEGRLLLPLHLLGEVQKVTAFERAEGYLRSVSIQDGGFMPLRGESGWLPRQSYVSLGDATGVFLAAPGGQELAPDLASAVIRGGGEDRTLGLRLRDREVVGGLDLWLTLNDERACTLHIHPDAADAGARAPSLLEGYGGSRLAYGLLGAAGLAVLARPGGGTVVDGSYDVLARLYGEAGALADRLAALVRSWDAVGRPGTQRLRIRAYPRGLELSAAGGEFVIEKPRSRLVLDWKG